MKFIVIVDHTCMVAMRQTTVDGRSVWVPERVTLCGHGLTQHGLSLLSDEVPPVYLCPKCDSRSNWRRGPPSFVRKLPKVSLEKISRYEHLPGRTGIHLVRQ